jgi:hypothetical protein
MEPTVKVRILPDGRLTRVDAATFLGLATGTLANWESRGLGPRSVKVGGRVFYFLRDLEAFRDTGARQAA